MKKYVITKIFNNKKHYFKSETVGTLAPDGKTIERHALGWFSPDLKDSIKYKLKEIAQLVACSYDGAEVEEIEEEEN